MTGAVRKILSDFESLPDTEKQELAREIIRRTLSFELPPLSDEEFILSAEEVFLELDRREAEDGEL
ncbi:MAG: hypothetical protein BWK80_48485 [Desulfobacteraceae bacterium IS3]|nr:MAG: hypothetical protein BWK80_48485 [Desulfobacteraceae bacterium IS3]